jgi:predicted permease
VLWQPALRTVELLADGAAPVALFKIGAVLARAQKAAAARAPARRLGDVPAVVVSKLIVHPALVLGVGRLLQLAGAALDGFALTVLMLVAALPIASNVPMLAERFGADTGRIARVVLLTTAFAFVTFSSAVSLLT